jgi:hypothetical protein
LSLSLSLSLSSLSTLVPFLSNVDFEKTDIDMDADAFRIEFGGERPETLSVSCHQASHDFCHSGKYYFGIHYLIDLKIFFLVYAILPTN